MNPHKLLWPVTIILSVIFASCSGRPEPKLRIGVSQCSSDDWRNKIKALTGISPVELLRDMRLREARRLLTTTELSISEIAYEAGFSTPLISPNVSAKPTAKPRQSSATHFRVPADLRVRAKRKPGTFTGT